MRTETIVTIMATLALLCAQSATAQQGEPVRPPSPLLTQPSTEPLLPENSVRQVAPHVHVLMGWPNIGFVVGERGVLVVDTGLGRRNGALVAREAGKLAQKGQKLYLATTHFHPEHAGGAQGFPAGTTVIRSRVQQAEADADGARMIAGFSARSEQMRELLQGAVVGTADVLYDGEYLLDLGGVRVRLLTAGPAHTRGDEVAWVVEDRVLLTGDVVQKRISPNMTCTECSPRKWIAALDRLAPLQPQLIVPVHSELGDGGLIAEQRAFLVALQTRTMALKAEGKSVEEAGRIVAGEFETRYSSWTNLRNLAQSVQKAWNDPG